MKMATSEQKLGPNGNTLSPSENIAKSFRGNFDSSILYRGTVAMRYNFTACVMGE